MSIRHGAIGAGAGFLLGASVVLIADRLRAPDPGQAPAPTARVQGIGGVFFKSPDPAALYAWYEDHLGIQRHRGEGHVNFCWLDPATGSMARTVWGAFRDDTRYFDPGTRDIMMNFRVRDLDEVLAALRTEGVTIIDKIEEYDYGRFGWILDLEGNKIELWEPRAENHDYWAAACPGVEPQRQ